MTNLKKLKISPCLQETIEIFIKDKPYQAKPNEPKIKVDQLISKVSVIYEKIRNTLEYHEEHLWRKNAIRRILRRRLLPGAGPKDIAKPLIVELIRGKYLENEAVPEKKINQVSQIIKKYIIVKNRLAEQIIDNKELQDIYNWLLGLMACEIEENLSPGKKEKALLRCMFKVVKDNVTVTGAQIRQSQLDIYYYIAIQRSLLKADSEIVSYQLFKMFNPNWSRLSQQDQIKRLAGQIVESKKEINGYLKNRINEKLLSAFKKYNALFLIIKDIIEANNKDARQVFADPIELESQLKTAVTARYRSANKKLSRSIIRAILYLFLTKMILALILEYPVDILLEKKVNYFALLTNIIFPPILMFVIGMIIKVPSKKNTQRIIELVFEVVYQKSSKGLKTEIKIKKKPNKFFKNLFRVLYFLLFFITFGLIYYALRQLNFNIASILIFMFFLSIVSFFGYRIRTTAKELVVLEKKTTFLSGIINFFTLPILRAGRYLSFNLSKINVLIFVMDFIIEAPFKMVMEVLEEWMGYLKEKKEDIY